MAAPHLLPLPYQPNSCEWFARIRHLPDPVLLDSCHDLSGRGRYDLISAAPIKHHSLNYSQLLNQQKTLPEILAELNHSLKSLGTVDNSQQLPFVGGLIGWLSYEAGYPQHQIPLQATTDHELPCLQMGIYLWAVINDHQTRQSVLVAHPSLDSAKLQAIHDTLRAPRAQSRGAQSRGAQSRGAQSRGAQSRETHNASLDDPSTINQHFALTSQWRSNLDRPSYGKAFSKIQDYIRAGDCYQINLAQRFSANYQGDSWQAYQQLRQSAAAPYSAFLPTANGAILCLSPETFLRFDGKGHVESKPIKGTAARHNDPAIDKKTANDLLQSAKNRAENLMIVDLLRNDLGQCCESGSINVDELFTLESFATVHHLVSQISGKMRSDINALDMLVAAFPGGSITGAPKKRAMEIIAELEPDQRSIYCGCIGYLSCDGRGEFNIAIRTLLAENNNIYCWAGGGIVSDSKEDEEYQESLSKVDKLLQAVGRATPANL
jgi:para-aminobenzoate synthetase component 1